MPFSETSLSNWHREIKLIKAERVIERFRANSDQSEALRNGSSVAEQPMDHAGLEAAPEDRTGRKNFLGLPVGRMVSDDRHLQALAISFKITEATRNVEIF